MNKRTAQYTAIATGAVVFGLGLGAGIAEVAVRLKNRKKPKVAENKPSTPAPKTSERVYNARNERHAYVFAAQRVMFSQGRGRYEEENLWKHDADRGFPDKNVDLEFYQIAYLAGRDMSTS